MPPIFLILRLNYFLLKACKVPIYSELEHDCRTSKYILKKSCSEAKHCSSTDLLRQNCCKNRIYWQLFLLMKRQEVGGCTVIYKRTFSSGFYDCPWNGPETFTSIRIKITYFISASSI